MARIALTTSLFMLAPGVLAAQTWDIQSVQSDAGIFSELISPDGNAKLLCGRVTGDDTSLAEDLGNSGLGHINFVLSEAVLGPLGGARYEVAGVTVSFAGQTMELPPFLSDDLGGEGWVLRLPEDHPLILEMGYGNDFTFTAPGQAPYDMPRSALSVKLFEFQDFCAPDEVIEQPSAPSDNIPFMEQVDAAFRAKCVGNYAIDNSAFTVMDLTDDGQDDLVVDYSSFRCTTGLLVDLPRPGCTEVMCQHDIYVAPDLGPFILYGVSVAQDRTAGVIRLEMDPENCTSMAQPAGCAVLMRWTGTAFGTAGLDGPRD